MPDLARTTPAADHLVWCTLEITSEIREKYQSWSDPKPWMEYEPTGKYRGDFEAEIANCSVPPSVLIAQPSVFEWPDQRNGPTNK